MSLKDLLIIKKITHSVISITAAFVALLGGWIIFSEMVTPPRHIREQIGLGSSHDVVISDRQDRRPNSVPTIREGFAAAHGKLEVKVETFEIDCPKGQSTPLLFTSRARQVRLKTKSCESKMQVVDSSVVNRTSGYSGTLFELERGGLTSDYMPLHEGDNNITLQTRNGSGEAVTTEVTVTRVEK